MVTYLPLSLSLSLLPLPSLCVCVCVFAACDEQRQTLLWVLWVWHHHWRQAQALADWGERQHKQTCINKHTNHIYIQQETLTSTFIDPHVPPAISTTSMKMIHSNSCSGNASKDSSSSAPQEMNCIFPLWNQTCVPISFSPFGTVLLSSHYVCVCVCACLRASLRCAFRSTDDRPL